MAELPYNIGPHSRIAALISVAAVVIMGTVGGNIVTVFTTVGDKLSAAV